MTALRRLLLSFTVSLHFFALFLVALCFPTNASAQAVGTHLGEGDVGAQISIIQMLKSKGAGSGFPVTVLLNINTSVQSASVDLANAVKNAGFIPIVRLTHVCSPFDAGVTPVVAVNAIRAAFGPDALIVYGNEINNPNECNSISTYVSGYNQIANLPNVSPAALDYYNGIHPVPGFFQQYAATGIEAIYQNAGYRAANAYGCTFGPTAESCDPLTTDTQTIGYGQISSTLYLTEFSLSPEGRKADAPDTDIKKVVQFIQAQAGKTGAQLITPLIRNVCNDEGEWLLYINGRVFTQFGTEVTDNCEGKSGYGYDTSIYPGYDAISDRYYLHPIRGILPAQSIPERKVEYIRADLARQGYEAYCAAPKSEIKLQISLVENMEKFIDLYGGVRLNAISEYDLDLTNVRTPIYRDVDDKRFLMNSMEEYWGFKDHWVGTPTEAELNSAPINSIVTTTQRCIQSVRTLTAVQLMCERLTDPSKCALLPRPIPGTNETVQTLLEKVAVAIPGYREGRISEGCNQMFHSVSPTASYGLSPLQTAILNTPLHLDRSYRLAFMVAAIEYEKFNPPDLFNFFSERDPEVDPRHEVLIAAFKIPDILTNKGGGEESGHQYWDDPAILTRNSLVPEKMRTGVYEPEADARRIATAQQAKNASAQNPGSKIYCVNGGTAEYGYVDGVGSPACKDELGKSVVDIINGNSPSCSDMEDEPVVQIEDSGTLHISDAQLQNNGLLYNPGYGFGETLLRDLFLNNIHQLSQQKTETPQQVISLYDIKRGWNIGRTAEVQFYLLYPIGYELGEVTHVLKQTFLTSEQQIKEEFTDPPADRFAMSGGSFGNRGGTADHTFTDTTDCSLGINPQTGLPGWICEEKDFALNLQEEGGGSLGLTGPQLGYWMRKAQLALTPLYTKAHAYLNSCTTTEQFLLGRCAGGIVATPTGSGGSSSGTGQCGLNYPVKAENLNPPYEQPTPFSSFPGQVPEDPRHGKAMFYGQGLMDQVLANRKAWGQIPQDKIQTCEGSDPVYKGCVALLRAGDIGREIWMQRPGGAIQGPFLVIDVAAKHDVSCLLERGWVVDVDRETAREWNMDGPIDIILHEQR